MFWIGVAVGSLSTLMLVVVYSACVVSGRISQKEEGQNLIVEQLIAEGQIRRV